jgi:hypothetical protein
VQISTSEYKTSPLRPSAPEALSIADLREWWGHKHFSSTRHYAIMQRRLIADYHKADYFARNARIYNPLLTNASRPG